MLRNGVMILVALFSFFSSVSANAETEPELRYYLLGGVSAVGGARSGTGVSAGAIFTECKSAFCSGYAQLVNYTNSRPNVTSADTLKGYSFFGLSAFAGLGMRTADNRKLIGQVTYGFGLKTAMMSIRRYTEKSQPRTEVSLSFFLPKGL